MTHGSDSTASDQIPLDPGRRYIDTLPALRAAAARLAGARELAVDLEAHSYRSFQVSSLDWSPV